MGIKGIRILHSTYDEWTDMTNTPENFDKEDVQEALKRTTADGSGFESPDELPDSDFDGFPEDGVENNSEDTQ